MSKSASQSGNENGHLRASCNIMRALAHPLRMRMLLFLDEQQSACVHEIFEAMNIEQSIASQHLRILRLAELVQTRREQKFIYYSLNYKKLNSASASAGILATFVSSQ